MVAFEERYGYSGEYLDLFENVVEAVQTLLPGELGPLDEIYSDDVWSAVGAILSQPTPTTPPRRVQPRDRFDLESSDIATTLPM